MKYKTLIEKNSDPILPEGRLTPPPPLHPRFASTTLLHPFPATAEPPTHGPPDKGVGTSYMIIIMYFIYDYYYVP